MEQGEQQRGKKCYNDAVHQGAFNEGGHYRIYLTHSFTYYSMVLLLQREHQQFFPEADKMLLVF